MRLTNVERIAIQSVIASIIGTDSEIWLFGSRMDDTKRGGDVDLFIESEMALESRLGLPVDIVSKARNAMPTPFQTIARANAARLEL